LKRTPPFRNQKGTFPEPGWMGKKGKSAEKGREGSLNVAGKFEISRHNKKAGIELEKRRNASRRAPGTPQQGKEDRILEGRVPLRVQENR